MAGPSARPSHGAHPVHVPHVRALYRYTAIGLGASMWFWLMYRARHDGLVVLGLRHPWDSGHGHGDKKDEHH